MPTVWSSTNLVFIPSSIVILKQLVAGAENQAATDLQSCTDRLSFLLLLFCLPCIFVVSVVVEKTSPNITS